MEIEVEHPRFQSKRLTVETASFFGSAKLLVNGRELQSQKTPHLIDDDDGEPAQLELENKPFDPIPVLKVDGELHQLAPPLKWYEWVWVGIPFILIPIGGCIGGGIGGFAIMLNAMVFRTADTPLKRWGLTLAITGLAFIAAITLSTMAQVMINGGG